MFLILLKFKQAFPTSFVDIVKTLILKSPFRVGDYLVVVVLSGYLTLSTEIFPSLAHNILLPQYI